MTKEDILRVENEFVKAGLKKLEWMEYKYKVLI
jgi:hypothetical protein